MTKMKKSSSLKKSLDINPTFLLKKMLLHVCCNHTPAY